VHKVETEDEAVRFLKSVKFALRYNSTPALPIASMYSAVPDKRRAIELTNVLLARNEAVETNIIADRLVLIHRDIVPILFALRTRFRMARLSANAERAFRLIREDGTASAGDVRRFLGIDGTRRPDAADLALAELQREFLVDRGPSSVPKNGVPYLSKEGFPYRVFERTHPELVKASRRIKVADAIREIVNAFPSATERKLAAMFKLCFTPDELKASLQSGRSVELADA
jgi:hypothetical protein